MVIGGALHLEREMVPLTTVRLARHASRNPLTFRVVPDIPLVATGNAALVAEENPVFPKNWLMSNSERLRRSSP
jgi:hypothetical protein